jgi:hypothetical protein
MTQCSARSFLVKQSTILNLETRWGLLWAWALEWRPLECSVSSWRFRSRWGFDSTMVRMERAVNSILLLIQHFMRVRKILPGDNSQVCLLLMNTLLECCMTFGITTALADVCGQMVRVMLNFDTCRRWGFYLGGKGGEVMLQDTKWWRLHGEMVQGKYGLWLCV